MNEAFTPQIRGHVRQWVLATKETLLDRPNLVVDSSFEIAMAALLGQQHLSGIALGFTDGKPVTKDLRTLGSLIVIAPIDSTPDTKSFLTKDNNGLRTIGTVIGLYTPPVEGITYDTVGLISNTSLLFAAASFPARTITMPIATEWTIYLKG